MAGGVSTSNISAQQTADSNQNYKGPFAAVTSVFFLWGFITVMNDVLIPFFEGKFALTSLESSLVQSAFFGAFFFVSLIYFIVSASQGDPISRFGYKKGVIAGLIVCGIGCGLFYPANLTGSYAFFLSALFILATGVTILQIAANPFATILGPPQTASARLNLSQGFNSLGTTIGPIVGSLLIYFVFSDGEKSLDSLGKTYLTYGIIFVLAAVMIALVKLPRFVNDEEIEPGAGALKYRQLTLGMLAIFCYVGAEVAIGSFLVKFFKLDSIAGIPEEVANNYLAFYWGGAMIGRLIGAISLGNGSPARKRILMAVVMVATATFVYLVTGVKNSDGQFFYETLPLEDMLLFVVFLVINYIGFLIGKSSAGRTLAIFSLAVILLLLIAVFTQGMLAFWAVIAIGLFNSIMWSNIFSLAISGLGQYAGQGSSLLVMCIVGGAVIPPIMGFMIDQIGVQKAFLIPILPYAYILFYGLSGYKPHKKIV